MVPKPEDSGWYMPLLVSDATALAVRPLIGTIDFGDLHTLKYATHDSTVALAKQTDKNRRGVRISSR